MGRGSTEKARDGEDSNLTFQEFVIRDHNQGINGRLQGFHSLSSLHTKETR